MAPTLAVLGLFNYARDTIGRILLNLQYQKIPEGILMRLKNRFPNWKHQKTFDFFRNFLSSENRLMVLKRKL